MRVMKKFGLWLLIVLVMVALVAGIIITGLSGDVEFPDTSELVAAEIDCSESDNAAPLMRELDKEFHLTDLADKGALQWDCEEDVFCGAMEAFMAEHAEQLAIMYEMIENPCLKTTDSMSESSEMNRPYGAVLWISRFLGLTSKYSLLQNDYAGALAACEAQLALGQLFQRSGQLFLGGLVIKEGLENTGKLIVDPDLPVDELAALLATLNTFAVEHDFEAAFVRSMQQELSFLVDESKSSETGLLFDLLERFAFIKYAEQDSNNAAADMKKKVDTLVDCGLITVAFHPNRFVTDAADFYRHTIGQATLLGKDVQPYDWDLLSTNSGRFLGIQKNAFGVVLLKEVLANDEILVLWTLERRNQLSIYRIASALKLYQRRTGALPESLNELVPEFLDAVPIDLMDGAAFRYDQERQLVYSLGRNLTDDGGDSTTPGMIKDEAARKALQMRVGSNSPFQALDDVVYLSKEALDKSTSRYEKN